METIKSRLGNISFTTENIEEFIKKYEDQKDLLPLYLDRIRNGYLLSDDMIEKIDNFDNSSKMKIIKEFNRCMEIMNNIIHNK
jgi:hypothetical protein